MKLGTLFFKSVTWFSKLLNKFHAPYINCEIRAYDFSAIKHYMQPGDVILTRSNGYFGNLFISGKYKHAVIVYDNNSVIEATMDGVHKTELFDLIKGIDKAVLLRSLVHTEKEREAAAYLAATCLGKKYDFIFEESNKAFYCSELVAFCLEAATSFTKSYKKNKLFDIKIIYPDNFYKDKSNFKIVYET